MAQSAALEQSPEGLKSAFALFNEMSAQLASSYDALQNKVQELNQELSTVSAQRLQELAQKEVLAQRLETLLNLLPGGVVVIDARGRISQANPASRDMLSGPLLNCPWREVIQRNFAPREDDGHEVSTLDGRRFSIATRSLNGDGQIVLLTDQTQTRALQAQLSRNERLSSLGKMVAALAHQIRTPLSAALLYNSHLPQLAQKPEQVQRCAEKVRGRLLNMERQVKDMLFFVRGELVLSDRMTIAELAAQLREATEAPLRENHSQASWQVRGGDSVICINRDALVGAVLNLVNNALQADPDQQGISLVLECFDGRLAISVLDQGQGVPEHIADALCDLFVTTKPQGTGIGLAVVQQVAKAHGGSFSIRSRRDRGTRASLLLPVLVNHDHCQNSAEVKL